jgi:hypothetical protein
MSDRPRDISARVRHGEGKPSGIRFEHGVTTGPFSVGRRGAWRITADDVEDMHAYLQFDGEDVSVLGLKGGNPPLLEGRPIGEEWVVVPAPGILQVGKIRIVFDFVEDDDDVLDAPPSGVQSVVGGAQSQSDKTIVERRAPDHPGARAPFGADVATVVAPHPLHDELAKASQPFTVSVTPKAEGRRAEGGSPGIETDGLLGLHNGKSNGVHDGHSSEGEVDIDWGDPAEDELPEPAALADQLAPAPMPEQRSVEVPTRVVDIKAMWPQDRLRANAAASPTLATPSPADSPSEKSGRGGIAGTFRNASLPKRIVFILLPLTFAAFIFRTAAHNAARARAAAAEASAPAASSAPSTKPKAQDGPPHSPDDTGQPAALAAPASSADALATPAIDDRPDRPGARTRERQAADLVSSGDLAGALKIYQDLAAAHPERAAFREAARILQQKVNQGTPPDPRRSADSK